MTKIRNARTDIMISLTEIKRIIRTYYEQFHTNKLDNLDRMNKFIETQKLPKLTQEERENQIDITKRLNQ